MRKTTKLLAFLLLVIITAFIAGCGDDNDDASGGIGITTTSLTGATVGTATNQTLTASGGTAPYTWALAAGSTLPAGLNLSTDGVLSGTPTTAGTYNFSITVTDSANPPNTATQSFSLTVNLDITTPSALPSVTANTPLTSVTLAVTDGTAPYTWALAPGSTLPAGLSLSTAGVISGTPTTAGTYNFSITVTDSATPAGTASKAFSIIVTAPATPLTVTTASLPGATAGTAYSQALAASGGTSPYTWSISAGTLPAGLTLTAGTISGTPTAAGTANFTVMVTDSATPTANTATRALSITVAAAGTPLTITTTSPLAAAAFGTAYSQTLAATGGSGAYTWALTAGTLPSGLSLDPVTGIISGTPTAPALPNPATSNFTIGVTGAVSGSTTSPFAITASLSASSAAGRSIFDTACAGCHSLGIYNSGGINLGGLGAVTLTSALNAQFGGGADHNGQTMTPAQITNMFDFLILY